MKLSLGSLLLGFAALALGVACAQNRDVAVADTAALGVACAEDCSKATSEPCFEGACDRASGACKVVPAADGTSCDDGQFCTIGDRCQSGLCKGGAPNPCGTTDCLEGVCNEELQSCTLASRPDGLPCKTDDDLCISGAACQAGACIGDVKDCRFADGVDECNNGVCDPKTGGCTTAPGNEGAACHDDGQCTDAQTCFKGKCQGGVKRESNVYSVDTTACHKSSCNPSDGVLTVQAIPFGAECPYGTGSGYECVTGKCQVGGQCTPVIKVGVPCTSAADDCTFAACNTEGVCTPSATNEGQPCDDRDACTLAETCQSGACKGVPRPGVEIYWREDFSDLAAGWTGTTPDSGGGRFGLFDPNVLPVEQNPFFPHRDHTATMDGKMLGIIDGRPGTTFDSPVIDVSKATGALILTAWSALQHDNSTSASIAVYDGKAWQTVWVTPFGSYTQDWSFSPIVIDVTRYKNPQLRIRVGLQIADSNYNVVSVAWFLDDFTLANRDCANAPVTPSGGGNGD